MSDHRASDRIRKLLALANHPGTGAEEASTAAALAAELAMRYNIDMANVREEVAGKSFEKGDAAITVAGGDRQAAVYMASALASLYGCKVILMAHPKPSNKSSIVFVGQPHNIDMANVREEVAGKSFEKGDAAITVAGGDRQAAVYMASALASLYGCKVILYPHPKPSNKSSIVFVGQPHNIDLAGAWLKYLWEAAGRTHKDYCKAERASRAMRSSKENYRSDISFRLHFGHTVGQRLNVKVAEMRANGVGSAGTALMVVNWLDNEIQEISAWMKETMKLKSTSSKARRLDMDAAIAGQKAGKTVGLDAQIKAASRANPALR